MSELENQVDEPITDVEQVEQAEQPETEAAELATDSEAEHEQQPQQSEEESPINQDKVNAAINKQYRLRKEAEERERKLQEQLQQQQQLSPNLPPQLPPEPDPFSDSYEQDKKSYNEALRKQAVWEAEQQQLQYQQQQQLLAQQQEQQRVITERAQSYTEKAKTLGIAPEELQQHGTAASQYFPVEMQLAIISDDDGPLLTKYFAQNPMEAMQVGQMDAYSAAMYVERNIRPKAKELTPKTTSAPKPPTKVDSSGANVDTPDPLTSGGEFY